MTVPKKLLIRVATGVLLLLPSVPLSAPEVPAVAATKAPDMHSMLLTASEMPGWDRDPRWAGIPSAPWTMSVVHPTSSAVVEFVRDTPTESLVLIEALDVWTAPLAAKRGWGVICSVPGYKRSTLLTRKFGLAACGFDVTGPPPIKATAIPEIIVLRGRVVAGFFLSTAFFGNAPPDRSVVPLVIATTVKALRRVTP